MAGTVEVDVSEFRDFFTRMGKAGEEFKQEMALYLESIGEEFLRVVTDEIERRQIVDTRLLLHSFEKDKEHNIWRLDEGNLSLEVGSDVEYAKYVNDGHWTIDPGKTKHMVLKDGTLARFVPGRWDGDKFIYEPGAKGGMLLKQQWVNAQPYFDSALRIMEKMFPKLLEGKMNEWLAKYF